MKQKVWLLKKNCRKKMNEENVGNLNLNCKTTSNSILLPKLFWPTVRKKYSSEQEKLLKFVAEGRELAKNFRSLKALVVKNSVLHDFGFGKVSPAKQL